MRFDRKSSRASRRQAQALPEHLTVADICRIVLGLVAVPLGAVILYRSATAGALTPPAILLGVAFMGFGCYRTWFAAHQYRAFRAAQGKKL